MIADFSYGFDFLLLVIMTKTGTAETVGKRRAVFEVLLVEFRDGDRPVLQVEDIRCRTIKKDSQCCIKRQHLDMQHYSLGSNPRNVALRENERSARNGNDTFVGPATRVGRQVVYCFRRDVAAN